MYVALAENPSTNATALPKRRLSQLAMALFAWRLKLKAEKAKA